MSAQFMVSEVRLAFSPGLLSQDSKMYRYIGLKQLYKRVIYWYILVEPPNRGCFWTFFSNMFKDSTSHL